MTIKRDLFSYFAFDVYKILNGVTKILESYIFYFKENYLLFKQILSDKRNELKFLKQEIKSEILLLKLSKMVIPSNFKKNLISILQREIIKKYKNYL